MPLHKKWTSLNHYLILTLAGVIAIGIVFFLLARTEEKISFNNTLRVQSLLLADQLQQSSDDLTRMVRSYVATSDINYKQSYEDTIASREGKKLKPQNHDKSYWGFMLDEPLRPRRDNDQTIPLIQKMQQIGLTPAELAKLVKAKTNSDILTHTEVTAMHLIEANYPLTDSIRAKATLMLQDETYHQAKANIIEPINEFNLMMSQRIQNANNTAEVFTSQLHLAFILLGIMVVWSLWRAYQAVGMTLGISLKDLHGQIKRIGNGDFQFKIPVKKGMEGSIIGLLAATQLRLAKLDNERKQAEEQLRLAAIVFSHAREGIMITDATTTIIKVNDTFTEMTGYSREELMGQNPNMLKSGRQSKQFYTEMWQTIDTVGYWSGELWNRRKNGQVYAEYKNISAVYDADGVIQNYVAMCLDITLMKEHQGQLERNAHYDILTNLPNRVLLSDRLNQAMVYCQRHHNSLAVVFLDLDGFKAINDTYGHDVGDELLVALSFHMKEALREDDTLSRFGGDEFIAVLAGLFKIEDCEPVLERLLNAAATPIAVGDIIMQVTASIGVAIYPQDNADADQLMRHADQAMYVAKQAGKNRYNFFDTEQDEAIKLQRQDLGNIRVAIERSEFVLYYQPKVNMHAGDIIGVEALIRWQHPVLGLIPPLDFLPIIEGHSISLILGEWVIDTALAQISQWQDMGVHMPISINISAYQLQQNDFVTRLAALLASYPDVNPSYLELEILETSALSDISQVSTIMNDCHDLGVRFALDDFGTGYSSLTYLRNLPAHLIKIDQSFVRGMLDDVDDLAIVEGVVGLAKTFKRGVIAEGVETIEHGTALLQLGCELAQGYGIARPMPAIAIPEWVESWKPDNAWLS